LRKRPHLRCNDGEATPSLAGARRFDARVEREEIGLECDFVDRADDVGNFFEEPLTRSMAETALRTTAPQRSALALVSTTSAPAVSARLADSLIDEVISATAVTVSSSEATCCSVRLARSAAAPRMTASEFSLTESGPHHEAREIWRVR
jgi:hypothetical protein